MAISNLSVRALDRSRYTLVVALAAVVAVVTLTGSSPITDQVYAPMALALAIGLLLTVRLAPYRAGGALVLLPAMAVAARFGLAALPAVAYVAIVTNLVRGMRGERLISTAGHVVLAYALAEVCAQTVPVVPDWVVFAIVFACSRLALWHLAARLDASPADPRAEHPEILLSLPLAPLGLLPLAADDRLGDGALLLALGALLALMFVVR